MAGRPKSLTDDQEQALIEWYRNRETVSRYCRRNRISRTAFYNALVRAGILARSTYKDQLVRAHVRRTLTLNKDRNDQQRRDC